MRIYNFHYLAFLLFGLCFSFSPVFGNALEPNLSNETILSPNHILADTTCGVTDSVFLVNPISCHGATDASATIQINGASGPLIYQWDSGSGTATATNLSAGKHFVTVTVVGGCMLVDSIIVPDKSPISYNVEATDILCIGINNGRIAITDTSNYSYAWNTGDSTSTIDSLSPSPGYIVSITDSEGCTVQDTISIGVERTLELSVKVEDATCNGINDGNIIINDSMDVTGFTFGWSTGDSTRMIDSLAPGLYVVAVADTSGCIAAGSIEVSAKRSTDFTAKIMDATCSMANNGSITINETTDVSGFQFNWSTDDSTQTITNLSPGTYWVTVTESDGCFSIDSLKIAINETFSITSTVKDASCNGINDGSIIINDTSSIAGLSFKWSTGDSTQSISNLAPGTYSVEVQDSVGCVITDSIMVGVNEGLSINLTTNMPTCNGVNDGSITVNDTNSITGLTFAWSNGDSTHSINNLGAGTYQVTVTDTLGCTIDTSIQLNPSNMLRLELSKIDESCMNLNDGAITANDTLDITGISFAWSNGDSTPTITDLMPGTYSVTITDTLGCTASQSIEINSNIGFEIDLSATNSSCNGIMDGSVTVNEGEDIGDLTIVWSTGDSSQTATGLAAGQYFVTVTDSANCSVIDSISISADSSLQVNLSGNNISCFQGNDGRVSASLVDIPSIDGLSFLWSTGDTTAIIDSLSTGNYEVTITDASGCVGTGGVFLAQGDSIGVSFVVSDIACVDMDSLGAGAILAVPSGGTGSFSFNWNTGDSTNSLINLTEGTYILTLSDSLNCTHIDSVILENPPILEISANTTKDATCDGTLDGSAEVKVSGGTSPFTILWSNGATTASIDSLNPGQYTVTVSDDNECAVIDTVMIEGTTTLLLNLIELQSASDSAAMDAVATGTGMGGVPPYMYLWDNGAVGDTVNNLSEGIHHVTMTDANGCSIIDSLEIQSYDLAVNIIEVRNLNCHEGATGRATAAPVAGTLPYTYLWSTGDTTATVTNFSAGRHSVTVTDADGLRGAASITLTQPAPIRFNLEIILPGCPNSADGMIIFHPTGTVGNPLYDFGVGVSADSVILGITPGVKNYGIVDGNGCRADTTFTIESLEPNVPTPTFTATSLGLTANFQNTSENTPSSYLWTFGDGDSSIIANPSHEYADTGNYEVCLFVSNSCGSDSSCQIIRIDPLPVPGISLILGRDTSSLSGQTVFVPIMADVFEDVAGIRGTFELSDPSVGSIQGVSGLNLPNLSNDDFTIQSDLITIDWSVADTSQLVSRSSGTPLFIIEVRLTGNNGDCFEIVPTSSEIDLQFTKVFNNELVPAPYTVEAAEICVAPTVSIAGNVSREESTPVTGVHFTNSNDSTFTTGSDGNYNFGGLAGGSSFTITAQKEDDILEGLTAFDIVRILQHILTRSPLTSPYKIIAADLDNSKTITSLDLVHLQRLILEKTTDFPNNKPWRFVPAAYEFITPQNPLTEDFPESIILEKLENDTSNINFVAIKVGDVVASENNNARYLPKSLGFEIKEQQFKAGETVKVAFNLEKAKEILGFQFELAFDRKALAFNQVEKSNYLNISDNNIGYKNIEYGQLKMLWINHQQLPIRNLENGLFELEFTALKDGHLSESIQFIKDGFPARIYSNQNAKIGVQNLNLSVKDAILLTNNTTQPSNTDVFALIAPEDEGGALACSDSIDNDMDGLIDCADADCFCECNSPADVGNLILNPDAEQSASDEWQFAQGMWTTRGANPSPQNGAAYFYASNSDTAELAQVIDLSADSMFINQGLIRYVFAGYTRSFDQEPSDEAQIIIEYKNQNDSILTHFNSGTITSLESWQLVTDTTLAPVGTASALIRLIAIRKNGSNNDAYFDNLSLTKLITDECVDPCENLAMIAFTSPAIPNGNGGSASISVSEATGPINYNWSNGATTAEVDSLAAGSYTIEISDSIGCTLMDSIEVEIDSSFFITLTSVDPTCHGDSTGSIIVAVTGGTAPFSYSWNDTLLMGDSLMNLPSGSFAVTVTDSTGLEVSSTAMLSTTAMVLNQDSSKIVNESCPGTNDGRLSLTVMGGMAPISFIIGNDTSETGVFNNLAAQLYQVTIRDGNGCSIQDSIRVGNNLTSTVNSDFTTMVNDLTVNFNTVSTDTTASYQWTFGSGDSSTVQNPVFTYSSPGAYEVCLTTTNDCGTETSCETVSLGATGPVRFVVNDLNGIPNDTVYVPITVENFVNIVSYQKTIQLRDTAIGRLLGIADPNLMALTTDNFHQIDDYTISNVWFDPSAEGQTVPNNTVIYNLMVMVNSSADTCVDIHITDSPVTGQVVAIMDSSVTEVAYEIVNGEVCTKETAQITGTITRETGSAVPGVQIRVSDLNITPTTDGNGDYLVEKLTIGNDYEITPMLNTPLLESVSTFDIVLINRHILGNTILDSPYKILAADVNRSGSITVFDLFLIQRAILDLNREFPNNNAWRFIPKDYQFPDPTDPFSADIPDSIIVTNVTGTVTGQDFIGIKIADVSYQVPNGPAAPRSHKTLSLSIDNQQYTSGEVVTIPIQAKGMDWVEGFQLELDFDHSSLELLDVEAKGLTNFGEHNIGLKHLNQGKIQMIWVAPANYSLEAGNSLFNLKFRAKKSNSIQNTLSLGNRYLTAESYTKDLEIGKVQLEFETTINKTIASFDVYPNPSTGIIEVNFENTNQEAAQINIYNLTGQLVKEIKDIQGNRTSINLNDLGNGSYLIMLKRADAIEMKSLILNK
jgi:PKD repeat protein